MGQKPSLLISKDFPGKRIIIPFCQNISMPPYRGSHESYSQNI